MLEDIKNDFKKFSLPSKPKSFGEEYYFPERIDTLNSPELGSWMFKLAAWKGYALRMTALSEIDRSWLKSQHDNKVSKKIAQESVDNKKVTKDYALGKLIIEDEEFKIVRGNLISKETELEGLRQVLEIYTMQIEVISREISRRSLDVKLTQIGIESRQ